KKVVSDYPGSEEADVALESLETIYVEQNEVDDYLNYTRSLGRNTGDNNSAREDSISFVAAEKQYMNAGFEGAVRSLSSYLNKYCPGGKFCSLALYYLADSYYRTKDKENALTTYNKLLNMPGNPYMEEASLRSAEIAFDKKDYSSALVYFKKLQTVAQTTENSNIARLGILRCSYFLNNHAETEKIATEILSDPKTPEAVKSEAKLNRAKARAQQNKLTDALKDLKEITIDTRTSIGAEAKFTLADVLFKLNRLNEAETEVLDFAKKGTPYQYWLASSFIVLADVYIQKGDDFQAKQYLLSLQKNYTVDDDIQPKINSRLTAIENRTKTKVIK
ncbi:MAG TPA: tetratricopeptide repeat protein, partial [Paludibacteraceae bacterium]|nr:tetratricopeptide repeat protein [Paludibacteraceae bacterium]